MRSSRPILLSALAWALSWPAVAAIDHAAVSADIVVLDQQGDAQPPSGRRIGRTTVPTTKGPFAIACDGLETPLSATFLAGSTRLALLSMGERSFVLPMVPAASGSKYQGNVGKDGPAMLWTKGPEAIFIPPGSGLQHACLIGEEEKAER